MKGKVARRALIRAPTTSIERTLVASEAKTLAPLEADRLHSNPVPARRLRPVHAAGAGRYAARWIAVALQWLAYGVAYAEGPTLGQRDYAL